MDLIEDKQNPFDVEKVPEELINIVTGQVASEEVANGLSTFLQVGTKCNATFIQERLLASRQKSFWDPEKRTVTPTFADLKKCVKSPKSTGLHIASEVLFRRLLAVSKQREVYMEDVLSHELAAVPPALFQDDGGMRKCTKSDLAKKLESKSGLQEMTQLPNLGLHQKSVYIIDAMAVIQGLNESTFQTFTDLAEILWQRILFILCGEVSCVVLVFDRYDNQWSIKQAERERRGASQETASSYKVSGTRNVPSYRKFMRSSRNKAALAVFISDYIV